MNWDILWLVIWTVALCLAPIIVWAGGVGASVAAYDKRVGLAVTTFTVGIILALFWLIIVVYNIVNQVLTLINGG